MADGAEAEAELAQEHAAGYVEYDDAEVATKPGTARVVAVEAGLAAVVDVGLEGLEEDEERVRADGVGRERVLVDCSRPTVANWDGVTGMEVEEKVECLGGAFVAEGEAWQRQECSG